jgi:coenzyme F420-reducing hydrogenase delta subunit
MTCLTVFACGRAATRPDRLPASVRWVALPCTGRVSTNLILASLARGADGVLVLGRHEPTCRLRGAEERPRQHVAQVAAALRLLGDAGDRVRFVSPPAGPDGTRRAVDEALAAIPASPFAAGEVPAALLEREDLDAALGLLARLSDRGRLAPSPAEYLSAAGLEAPLVGRPVLAAGPLPWVGLLAGERLLRPVRPGEILHQATDVVATLLGAPAGVWIGPPGSLEGVDLAPLRSASSVITLDAAEATRLAKAGVDATPLDALVAKEAARLPCPAPVQVATLSPTPVPGALGHRTLDLGPDPLAERLGATRAERSAAEALLAKADQAGARALVVPDADALLRWALVTRQGTWRSSQVRPALPLQLTWLALQGVPVSPLALALPAAEVGSLREVAP